MALLSRWRARVRALNIELYTLYLAYRDPRVPWLARLVTLCVVAYAFSPIDLIPDFIPILGVLDDLLLVPLGIWLAMKLIPPDVLDDYRPRARAEMARSKPVNWIAASIIILLWLLIAVLLLRRFLQ